MPSAGTDWIEEQPDVLRSCAPCPTVTKEIIKELKRRAVASPRSRARWCAHPDNQSETQEMLIVLTKQSCIPPHRHSERSETLCVLEGRARAWFFDEAGHVVRCLEMAPASDGGTFLYRTKPDEFHTLELKTDFFVFLETTRGPFDPNSTQVASLAPRSDDLGDYREFFAGLKEP